MRGRVCGKKEKEKLVENKLTELQEALWVDSFV